MSAATYGSDEIRDYLLGNCTFAAGYGEMCDALIGIIELHSSYTVRYHPTVRKMLGPRVLAEEGTLRCANCHGYGEIENLPWPCPTVQEVIRCLAGGLQDVYGGGS